MKSAYSLLSLVTAAAFAAILGSTPALTRAASTDLATAPLGTTASATVLPNLMFILDDSGSMSSQHMPDEVGDATSCKFCDAASGTCNVAAMACDDGYPPYYAAAFNTIYYNPNITYKPAVDSLGVSLGNASPTAARSNGFDTSSSTKNLTTGWREVAWCDTDARSGSELTGGSVCKRNGIHTPAAGWIYNTTSNTSPFSGGFPVTTGTVATSFRFPINFNTAAHYYNITPREHCTDFTLGRCTLSSNPTGTFEVPAPVRWCNSASEAAKTTVVTTNPPATPICQSKVSTTYKYPRFGTFKRVNIVSSTANYPRASTRSDCTGTVGPTGCSYAQEIQNFANWYSYYRTRMLMMKTSSGHAFTSIDDKFRVGFTTINFPDDTTRFVALEKFDATQKAKWYDMLYKVDSLSGTPLRRALARVGRHYAGLEDEVNAGMPVTPDPVQYSCQQNFALLTTDGYWNSENGVLLDGTTETGNQDNVVDTAPPFYVTRSSGTFDGNLSGSANSLADVAMYYYKTDLRPTGPLSKNNVPTTPRDGASHQHMVTFTLGLGLDGLMTFQPDYEIAKTGDFARIKAGNPSGCSWTTGACNWPEPKSGQPSALDDLWHAAVNGRGKYFSAKNPDSLKSGLSEALATIQITTGAAAASATSTPNITPTNNFIYSSTYRTVKWDGEVVAEKINTSDGTVIPGVVWAASGLLDLRVSVNSDTRTIYTFTTNTFFGTNNRKNFLYANMSSSDKADFFDNKCSLLPQCPALTSGQKSAVNSGDNLINWLRGQSKKDDGVIFRDREHVLGDVVNAKPAFVEKPNLLYGDAVTPTYSDFKLANASRQPVLYIPANDGMLHAFNADTGQEMWAWVPRMLWPELWRLASTTYDSSHRYYVDGSPVSMDVFIGGAWKTILVGGLNSGGRGYYALDITDPNSPKGLWEVCADPTGKLECTDKDDNIGYSYGQAIITKDPKDGKWVVIVSSGYNNVNPGDGKGYIFIIDAATGIIKDKKDTGVGDNNSPPSGPNPSGFAKISGYATNFMVDNTTTIVYGGDLFGNVWSFDVEDRLFQRIGQAKDASGKYQSITTRPDVTRFDTPAPAFNVVYVGTGRFLGATDVPNPADPPLSDPTRAYQQSVYGFKDTGADLGDLRAPGANLVQQTLSVIDGTTRTISNNAVDWSTQNGWYVDLNPASDSPGERVSIDPQLVKGVLIVVTNEPNSDACSAGGDSFLYQFDYRTGAYVPSAPGAVVGVKLGSALAAGFVVYRLPSGQLKYTGIDVTGQKKTGGVNPGAGGALGSRASWRELYQ
jgi:type IV pilus assembly protein PilY1